MLTQKLSVTIEKLNKTFITQSGKLISINEILRVIEERANVTTTCNSSAYSEKEFRISFLSTIHKQGMTTQVKSVEFIESKKKIIFSLS